MISRPTVNVSKAERNKEKQQKPWSLISSYNTAAVEKSKQSRSSDGNHDNHVVQSLTALIYVLTLVQVSVSGLHCRMSLTMVAFPFSTAQYRAVLLSWRRNNDVIRNTQKPPHQMLPVWTHLSSDVNVSILLQQSSDYLHVAAPHCSNQDRVPTLKNTQASGVTS